jgi:hypothetical protein
MKKGSGGTANKKKNRLLTYINTENKFVLIHVLNRRLLYFIYDEKTVLSKRKLYQRNIIPYLLGALKA